MELKLFRNTTIRDLKKQFSKAFPYLKLEFFRQQHSRGKGTGLNQKISDDAALSDVISLKKEGSFSFRKETVAGEFEQQLQNEFGLPVQVFRRSGDVWLETTRTDGLTLGMLNGMGEAASRPIRFNINSLFL